jgi:voltage-gated potassium channel
MAKHQEQQIAENRRRLGNAALASLAVFIVGVVGYRIIDGGQHSFIDVLYMTVITLTTVGYGEIIPLEHHPWGRVFTMVLLIAGMGTLLYFLGAITTFLVEGNLEHVFWRRRMKKAIDELKEHFIVCGDRIVAANVVDELRRVQRPVVAVVPEGSTMHPLHTSGELLYVEGDPADDDVLREAGIARAAGVVAAMESDRDNVLVTLAARQTNPIMRIVAMMAEPRNENKLRRAGADSVVSPALIGGLRIASELIRPKVVTFLDSMLRDRDRNLRIDEIEIGPGSTAIGKKVGALGINQAPGLLLLALIEPGAAHTYFKPSDDVVVTEGAALIVMGGPKEVGSLRDRFGGIAYGKLMATGETKRPGGL